MAQKKQAKKAEPRELVLVQSKVKAYIKSKNMLSAGDLVESLNEAVYKLLDDAVRRAGANDRKTVQARDL